jgi:hypothetical protein
MTSLVNGNVREQGYYVIRDVFFILLDWVLSLDVWERGGVFDNVLAVV